VAYIDIYQPRMFSIWDLVYPQKEGIS